MAVIGTSTTRFSAVIKHEYEPSLSFCRDVAVVNDAANTFKIGTVLGKVTATGKYKICEATAVDGSQVAAGVVIADVAGNSYDIVIPATTDVKVLVITRGPAIVGANYLVFGASVNDATKLATAQGQLKALGIIVEAQV